MAFNFVPQVQPINSNLADTILAAGNARAQLQAQTMQGVGNTIASLGQIPQQQQELGFKQAQMQMEQARAQRESQMAQAQMVAMQREQSGQQALGEAFGAPDATPDTIKQHLTAAGRADLIPQALENYSKSQDAIQTHLKNTQDQVGMELYRTVYPYLDKPDVLPGAVQLATKNLLAMGLDKQTVTSQAQMLLSNPEKIAPAVQQLIKASPSALAAEEAYRKAHQPIAVGLEQQLMDPITGQPIGGGSSEDSLKRLAQVTAVKAQAAETPSLLADRQANLAKSAVELENLKREQTGAPGSVHHTNTFKSEDAVLTKAQGPYDDIVQQAANVKNLLNSKDRMAISQAPGAVLNLINSHARYNPGNVAQVTAGNTVWTKLDTALKSWNGDPNSSPYSPELMKQVSDLADTIAGPATKKTDLTNEVRQKLADTPVSEHPQILSDWHKQITSTAKGQGVPPSGAIAFNKATGEYLMPDGSRVKP